MINKPMSRRHLATSGTFGLSTFAFWSLSTHPSEGKSKKLPLVPDTNNILSLPKNFRYHIIDQQGTLMNDGYFVPGRPDGMACFEGPNNQLILMRNHELSPEHREIGPLGTIKKQSPFAYDQNSHGGVSRLVFDPNTRQVTHRNMVLMGTNRNCAGGPSPWGWLSCEENVAPNHGFVFLCETSATSAAEANKIENYGRFNHEAVCIDPTTHAAYLTEDRKDGCLYRFVPFEEEKSPFHGTLAAMKVKNRPHFDTGSRMSQGERLAIEWVTWNSSTKTDNLRLLAKEKGAATVHRGEGIWLAEGEIFFAATSGGPQEHGQIFRLIDEGGHSGYLECLVQAEEKSTLDKPDNITVSPWGSIFIAEDGKSRPNGIKIATPQGNVSTFAENLMSSNEIAGVCFSPSGQFLFFNFQVEGLTFAVEGPFAQL